MDNVLVCREKVEYMNNLISSLTRDYIKVFDDSYVTELNMVLDMPDFVESEEDVELVAKAVYLKDYPNGGSIYKTWDSLPYQDKELYNRDAQSAINALRRKDGE